MSDLVQFRMTRSVQRRTAVNIIEAVEHTGSGLVPDMLAEIAEDADPVSVLADLRGVAEGYMNGGEFIDPRDHLERNDDLLARLAHLDLWLTSKDNEPEPGDLERVLKPIVDASAASQTGKGRRNADWNQLRRRLGESLIAASAVPLPVRVRSRLVRLLVLAGLVEVRAALGKPITASGEVNRLLTRQTVLLPSPPFPLEETVGLPRRAKLAREPAISDLFVVRDEWSCYLAGEISHIENIVKGESKVRSHRRVDETEITATTESERFISEVRESQTTDRFELAEELATESSLTVGLEAQVDTSGRYGPTQVDTHIGASLDYSVSEAKRRAAIQAREVVGKAATRVEQRVRQVRTTRSLSRIDDYDSHRFDNTEGTEHVRGVYRWVDKVQRLQLFRYPNRYLLEFQVPEPATRVRYRFGQMPPDVGVEYPPDAPPYAGSITVENYQGMVAVYRASGAPAPPEPRIGVSAALALEVKTELPKSATWQWNAPVATATDTISVPPGYAATSVAVDAVGTPVRADWWREYETNDGAEVLDKFFHRIEIDVMVGEHNFRDFTSGQNAAQGGRAPRRQLGDSFLAFEKQSDLTPYLVEKVPVVAVSHGAGSAAVNVRLSCVPLAETLAAWRNAVYDTLQASWTAWKRRYDEAVAAQTLAQPQQGSVPPARAKEVIREELKRQVIEMLMGQRFEGRNALIAGGPPDTDLDLAQEHAPEIQFLEQAFEWQNLTYAMYPYYWAAEQRWDNLATIDGADPEFARFLRSGSARVVVPARPGFEESVNHYVVFGEPWDGGPAPVPDEELYVSVAREIQDLMGAPDSGEPGECWEVRLPTTLLWLDDRADLPSNSKTRLGKPPLEPVDPICAD